MLLDIARELGLKATAQEIQQKIVSYPVFPEGKFVGFKEYQQILDWNHIPVQKFEESLAEEILLEKVTRLLTAGCTVSENEVWEEIIRIRMKQPKLNIWWQPLTNSTGLQPF